MSLGRYFQSFHLVEDTTHAVEMLDWHNNPPSKFFAETEREYYARSWLKRLELCGLLGDRQNYLRVSNNSMFAAVVKPATGWR